MKKNIALLISLALAAAVLSGCADSSAPEANTQSKVTEANTQSSAPDENTQSKAPEAAAANSTENIKRAEESGLFSERDMKQTADLSSAKKLEAKNGETLEITKEGVYILSGTASDCTVRVDVSKKEKVQIVLDGANITNSDFACIYVKSADKVFVTSNGENSLAVDGKFIADGNTNVDAVIFSKDDLTLNGTGTLRINSSGNGITCKDSMKITGGTYDITAKKDALEANDAILIADGTFTLNSQKNAMQCKNEDKGNIYIAGGKFDITASEDAIKGISTVQTDGGEYRIKAAEGIEGTFIQINGGNISIEASDDGINASRKSKDNSLDAAVEINGGDITIVMGPGDTDGIDSNGSIYVNGGTVNITGNSSFDYDNEGILSGGTVYVNGEQVFELPNQIFGPDMKGGRGGRFPDGNFPDRPERGDKNRPDRKGEAPDGVMAPPSDV